MRPFLLSIAFLFAACASFAQNGLVLSGDGSAGDAAEGAIYIQELLDGYTDEGSVALNDTNSPEAKIEFCKSRLSYAERSLAQVLLDYEYSVSISVTGVAPHNLGTECTLNSTRKAEIKLEGPTE